MEGSLQVEESNKSVAGSGLSGEWLVRNDKSERFGPVGLEVLQEWARDGRLAPTNEVSLDGVRWQPVTAVAELEMVWVAEVSPGGFYGPIHYDALQELIREGSIAADARLFVRGGPEAEAQLGSAGGISAVVDQVQVLGREVARVVESLAALQSEVSGGRAALSVELAGVVGVQDRLAGELRREVERLAGELAERRGAEATGVAELGGVVEQQGRVLQELVAGVAEIREATELQSAAVQQRLDVVAAAASVAETRVLQLGAVEIEARLTELHDKVGGLEAGIDGVCQRLDQVDSRVAEVGRGVVKSAVGEQAGTREFEGRGAEFYEPVEVEIVEAEFEGDLTGGATSGAAGKRTESGRGVVAEGVGIGESVRGERATGWAKGANGVSLIELEMQARRELERLGSSGGNPFKRKR